MKVTIVPAQITTVEDRVAGNLSLNQILLLALPLFFNCLLYIALPPMNHLSAYKIIGFTLITISTSSLAIRIKGKLAISWLIVLAIYSTRPRYYLSTLNENTSADNEELSDLEELDQLEEVAEPAFQNILSSADEIYVSHLVNSESAKFSFINRKGSLNVQIIENVQKG